MTGQRKLRADSLEDVMLLATCVLTTPAQDRPKLLAAVHNLDLMRFTGYVRPTAWLIRKTKGRAGLVEFFMQVQARSPADVDAFVAQTANHILAGNDLEDQSSVGGLSQREIDAFQQAVSFSLLNVEPSA